MAHFVFFTGYTDPIPDGHVPNSVEYTLLWKQVYAAINGDGGGTWSPSAFITVGGSGFQFTGLNEKIVLNKPFWDFIRIYEKDGKAESIFEDCRNSPFKSVRIGIECERIDFRKHIGEANVAFIESNNREAGFLIVIRDITEEKEVKKQLHFSFDSLDGCRSVSYTHLTLPTIYSV